MEFKTLKIHISDSIGSVSASISNLDTLKAMVVLAHGAGAGMHHNFMVRLSESLASYGIGTLRFNFPYMEKGKKMPDFPAIAEKTVQVVLEETHRMFPDTPIVGAGKSFGGRMTSQLLSREILPFVKAIIFYGFPLHPMGKPGTDRAKHLEKVPVPMLFLQGTNDALAELSLITSVCGTLSSSTLMTIEKADHSFNIGKKDTIVNLSKNTHDWLQELKIISM
jgi:hypothetical protein